MKKGIKICSLLLAVGLFTGILTSCTDKNESQGGSAGDSISSTTINKNHYASIKERNGEYLVKDGETDYKIIVSSEAKTNELDAASLIAEYFGKALDVKIQIIKDSQINSTSFTGKYISVGDTTLMRLSGIAIPLSEYGSSGFRIVTKQNTIFISGARNVYRTGTYYGAQEFLYHTINWRAYAKDEIRYDVLESLEFADYDIVEIPDFDNRRIGYQQIFAYPDVARLLRMSVKEEGVMDLSGHSHFQILPPSKYFKDHRDWYAWDPETETEWTEENDSEWYHSGQLCLTNEEMTEEFIAQLTNMFFEYPDVEYCHIGMQDNEYFCECYNCQEALKKYNTNTAGINVIFTNKVAKAVSENVAKVDPERNLKFETFAYHATFIPPADLVNGKWVPHCDEVIPADNVYIQFTPYASSGTEPLTSEFNYESDLAMQGWDALTDNISVWRYVIHFGKFQMQTKNWDVEGVDLRYYKSHGVTRIYDQGPIRDNVTQLTELRIWVTLKMMWDTSLEWETLAREFIENFYGVAAPDIQNMYDLMTTHYEYLATNFGFTSHQISIQPVDRPELWSFNYVDAQRKNMEAAFSAIEPLKVENPIEYNKYYWRVAAAYFENIYMQLEWYADRYTASHKSNLIKIMEELRVHYDINRMSEGSLTITTLLDKWRATQ